MKIILYLIFSLNIFEDTLINGWMESEDADCCDHIGPSISHSFFNSSLLQTACVPLSEAPSFDDTTHPYRNITGTNTFPQCVAMCVGEELFDETCAYRTTGESQ